MALAKNIMIIDDDADDRDFFCEALMEADNSSSFITATNGQQALDILFGNKVNLPDLIFLDLNMPGMNGWQTLARLRKDECCKKIPVIIYSTSQANENYEKAKEVGAVYFFAKPSRFADLVHGIYYVLNNKWDKVSELNRTLSGR